MLQDLSNIDLILTRLSGTLGPQGAALQLKHDTFADTGEAILKVEARLSGHPSEADLVRILEAGRRVVREAGTDAKFWTEIAASNVVEFCFAEAPRTASL